MKLWQYLKDRFTSYVAPTHEEVVEAKLVDIVNRAIGKGYGCSARHNVVDDIVTIRIRMSTECAANLEGKPNQAFWARANLYISELRDHTNDE